VTFFKKYLNNRSSYGKHKTKHIKNFIRQELKGYFKWSWLKYSPVLSLFWQCRSVGVGDAAVSSGKVFFSKLD